MNMRKADIPAVVGEYIYKQKRPCWYFSKMEIEVNSPSRKDGIDLKKETHLRNMYCSFLQELGVKLRLPHLTIATSIMFCHRFYLHQSHVKNDCLVPNNSPCCLPVPVDADGNIFSFNARSR